MNKNKILLGIFVMALGASTAFGGDLLDGGPKLQPKESADTHRNVTGTVERIESDMVFLKTNEGTTRNFAVKESKREGLKSLQPGDQVSLELDEGNSIIDIHKDGAMAQGNDQKGIGDRGGLGAGDSGHKSVVGTVENFDPAQKILILKSDQGKSESYQVKDAAATKLNGIKKGDKVTLEIDEQNRVMDAHS
ncbi:MAG TPA: hypothetical protein VFA47_01270 [Candidatus Manganitrophaceae bacterium]|nr:hypothetical protein [Candidatus Manganitrophaceae bacterium]